MIVPGGQDLTYKALFDKVGCVAAALSELGIAKGDRIAILSENCPEWALADWAGQSLGVVVVPIYPTLPKDQALYIARDCGAKLVLGGDAKQMAKLEGETGFQSLLLKGDGDSLMGRSESAKFDEKKWNESIDAVTPEDVATIIYTSGTTGVPKGAILTHGSCLWTPKAVLDSIEIRHYDTFFSFLPMSHVYERIDGQFLPILLGATVGYARSLASLGNDLLAVQPSVILCVPRFLESMRDRVLESVRKSPPIRQKLFHAALDQGTKKFLGKPAPFFPILDKLVGAKIRARMGGKVRLFVSGGAALPPKVAEFYGAFGLLVLQGYGLTETTAGIVVNRPESSRYWTIGEPLPGIETKIADDGELLFRGPAIMRGYWNLPEDTAAAIDGDGWFHTGDIGEWDGPSLKITDRKKDLLVLANGKNVAPQKIENEIRQRELIQEVVVLGDGMDFCCALIVPQFDLVRQKIGAPEGALLAENKDARALIKKELDAVNKTLAPFELVKKFAILDQPFTIESGELTPSLKVKRKVVKERYASILDEWKRD